MVLQIIFYFLFLLITKNAIPIQNHMPMIDIQIAIQTPRFTHLLLIIHQM